MTNTNPTSTPARRLARIALLGGAALSIATLAACSGTASSTASSAASGPKVMFLGDSIAQSEAPALAAALKAAGATLVDATADGGGTVVDPGGDLSMLAESTWDTLATAIPKQEPTTILYQITMYDQGTPEQQRQGYQRLADAAGAVGADLVIVSTPPVADEFMDSYRDQAATTSDSARAVADASGGSVTFLDASELWGTDPAAEEALRSTDMTHNCQQGAASFASWVMSPLSKTVGVTAVPVEEWATGDWTGDEVFAQYDCPVAGR